MLAMVKVADQKKSQDVSLALFKRTNCATNTVYVATLYLQLCWAYKGRNVLYMHTESPFSALLHIIALRSGLAIHLIDL